jgi:ferrochelatase
MNNQAVLLVNLGSPDDCTEQPVREYLNQFLMDPYVIQVPWLIRRMIVSLFVLPKRPKDSAEAYRQVWTDKGSPLVSYSKELQKKVQQKLSQPVHLAMRYGKPSIESQLLEIAENKAIEEVFYIPLYPHYADSTVTTSIREAERVIAEHQLKLRLRVKPPFYNESDYIDALVENAAPYLFERKASDDESPSSDLPHLLFSYHGLPESHLTKADPTGKHCLKSADCCATASSAHRQCYRHQVLETTRLFVEKAGLAPSQYSVAFQSRLGRAKWLEPSTENTLIELANKGIKNLVVICPAFVTDCLETLEEIAIRGEEVFLEAGGRSLKLAPCLNLHPDWVNVIVNWCNQIPISNQTECNVSEAVS